MRPAATASSATITHFSRAERVGSLRRNIEGFRNWIAQLPETIGVFVVSGSEDFLVHIAVRDNQDLYAFVIDRLTQRPKSPTSAPAWSTSTCTKPRSPRTPEQPA